MVPIPLHLRIIPQSSETPDATFHLSPGRHSVYQPRSVFFLCPKPIDVMNKDDESELAASIH
jgi:hypothetical protein